MTPMKLALALVAVGGLGLGCLAAGVGLVFGPGWGLVIAGAALLPIWLVGLLLVNVDARARR